MNAQPAKTGRPTASRVSATRLEKLIRDARRITQTQFPKADYPWFAFNDAKWNLSRHALTSRRRAVRVADLAAPRGRNIYFTDPTDADAHIEDDFVRGVKAWLVLSDFKPARFRGLSRVACWLWVTVKKRHADQRFDWSTLTAADFARTEDIWIARGMGQSTISSHALSLRQFSEWLMDNDLSGDVWWEPRTSVPSHSRYRTGEGKARRADRLPTRGAIEGLADIYHRATDEWDRLLICAVGLLFLGGFRTSELLSLPYNALVQETGSDGVVRRSIRYWPNKARGKAKWATRRLSPLGGELAALLFAELLALTRSARVQARRLRATEGRVHLPMPDTQPGLVSQGDLAWALGQQWSEVNTLIRRGSIPLASRGIAPSGEQLFNRRDVEHYLTQRQGGLPSRPLPQGKLQRLETSLFLFPYGLPYRSRADVSPLLVARLEEWDLPAFLHGVSGFDSNRKRRSTSLSAFQRFGIMEPMLSTPAHHVYAQMRPTMLRHFLNTIAHKAGMSAFQITLWMHRSSSAQTAPYLHEALYDHSPADFGEVVREMVRMRQLHGALQEQFNHATPAAQEQVLARIQHAHKLRDGICTICQLEECPKDGVCEDLCGYRLTTQDPAELAARQRTLHHTDLAIQTYQIAKAAGLKVQPRQLALATRVGARLHRELSESGGASDGAL